MTRTDDFDYELPRERIAQSPLPCRTDARLMIVDRARDKIDHAHIRDLPEYLRPNDALVLNNTRVIPAQLFGYRTRTRGRWHGLFLAADQSGLWRILGKTRGKLQAGETVTLQDHRTRDAVVLTLVAHVGGGEWIARPESDASAQDLLSKVGRVPLPGYIRGGQMVDVDREAYQTVFAEKPGAVAAPTAGLHFTHVLLKRIEDMGVAVCRVTLHVGIGTFRPITSETVEQHRMHAEWGCVDRATVDRLDERRKLSGRIIAVGTTVMRTLETAASDGVLKPWDGETQIFIQPGYEFRAVDALLTNFHLPRSTLLVLVRAFGGDELIRRAYGQAIRDEYRFYSYGDAMLIV